MGLTYGEQMLAQAERRARASTTRRRLLTLFLPGALTSLWAVADLLDVRLEGSGGFALIFGAALPIIWTALFVIFPLYASLGIDPMPSGAVVAIVAGPILTPMLFGPGGWRWWHVAIMVMINGLTVAAELSRRLASR